MFLLYINFFFFFFLPASRNGTAKHRFEEKRFSSQHRRLSRCVCELVTHQTASVDATAPRPVSGFVLRLGRPLAGLQTRLRPWCRTEVEIEGGRGGGEKMIKATANYVDSGASDEATATRR